jgi:cytochrome bd-type quinol oxidase subunit 1
MVFHRVFLGRLAALVGRLILRRTGRQPWLVYGGRIKPFGLTRS